MRTQAAIAAVARHFSATPETTGRNSPHACLTIAGKRIAIEVAAIKQKMAARPRLRFDKVALRFIGDLRAALSPFVPDGRTAMITITAPIRLASKTAAVVEEETRACLACRPTRVEIKETIHGNLVRVRLAKGLSKNAPKVIGFVHNRETDPDVLFRFTQALLQRIRAAANRRTAKRFAGDRWLVISDERSFRPTEIYRHVLSHFAAPTGLEKILLLLADGRVETLTGSTRGA